MESNLEEIYKSVIEKDKEKKLNHLALSVEANKISLDKCIKMLDKLSFLYREGCRFDISKRSIDDRKSKYYDFFTFCLIVRCKNKAYELIPNMSDENFDFKVNAENNNCIHFSYESFVEYLAKEQLN